ncbi:hypothetical protein HDU93_000640 [Gonapodya sp. JEL0774]|nr:hypothetical protein HDU93_000640 [Gonapodya sp. JEL0774]
MAAFSALLIGGIVCMEDFKWSLAFFALVFAVMAPYYVFVVQPRVSGRAIEKPFLQDHLKFLMNVDAKESASQSRLNDSKIRE